MLEFLKGSLLVLQFYTILYFSYYLYYLTWINFWVDKISRFRELLGSFAKINLHEYFEKSPFVKLNPREMHTKILVADLKLRIQKVLINVKLYVKYLQNTPQGQSFCIWNHLNSFQCYCNGYFRIKYIINQKSVKFLRTHYTILLRNFVTTSDILFLNT